MHIAPLRLQFVFHCRFSACSNNTLAFRCLFLEIRSEHERCGSSKLTLRWRRKVHNCIDSKTELREKERMVHKIPSPQRYDRKSKMLNISQIELGI